MNKAKKSQKRIIALVLTVVMTFNVLQVSSVYAEGETGQEIYQVQDQEAQVPQDLNVQDQQIPEPDNIFNDAAIKSIAMGTCVRVAGELIVSLTHTAVQKVYDFICSLKQKFEVYKYQGFKDFPESIKGIKDISVSQSDIKIYGQEKAKSQCFSALSGCLQRIEDIKNGNADSRSMQGNIVYMVGPSGVGKTTMAKAIADAILKHSERSSFFIDSSAVSGSTELGEQLFRLVNKYDIGKNRNKNLFGLGDTGTYKKLVESPILDHMLMWPEAVVIIDEYDKMKMICKPSNEKGMDLSDLLFGGKDIEDKSNDKEEEKSDTDGDRSADEILKSIASTGKYRVSLDEIDCSKILFIVTTNETRKQLEENFGVNGKTGGGIQRLNVIEFDYLGLEDCKSIVSDLVKDLTSVLTAKNGYFKAKSVKFSEETLEQLANHIYNDKVMQGRSKYKLKDEILNLFTNTLGEDVGKDIEVTYVDSQNPGEMGTFSKNVCTNN